VERDVAAGDPTAGWAAFGLGVVTLTTFAALLLFFAIGAPFGAINDAGNGLIGVLSAALALLLHRRLGSWAGLAAAVIGAAVAVFGTWLVMTDTTGFLLAGFVSTVGFGLIGVWLGVLAWSPMTAGWEGRIRWAGRGAAACMVIGGFAALPGALMGIDDFAAVPPWLWLFGLGWLGTYVFYPIWSLLFGRASTTS
jgi:hypothetical protein